MFGSNVLDVAVGVVFIYLLLSLVCTAISEAVATFINRRGENLFAGIKNLLNDPQFTQPAQQLYTHGLVAGISQDASNPRKRNRLPSYMAPNTFASALLDILASQGAGGSLRELAARRESELQALNERFAANADDAVLRADIAKAQAALNTARAFAGQAGMLDKVHSEAGSAARVVKGPGDVANLLAASKKFDAALLLGRALAAQCPDPLSNLQSGVERLPDGHTKQSLLVLLDKTRRETAHISDHAALARHQLERFQANVETWFNESMDRVAGWYKRWSQKILLAIAVVLVVAVNADTIMLVKRLTRDSALRAAVVTVAEGAVHNGQAAERQHLLTQAGRLGLPLGWVVDESDPDHTDQKPQDVYGWLFKAAGLLLSVLAVSLGAPFWFDTLSKFINLRGAGRPPGAANSAAQSITPVAAGQ